MNIFVIILSVILAVALLGFLAYQVYGLVKDIRVKRKQKKENIMKGEDEIDG